MEVIEYEDYSWVLLRHGEALVLDVLCSHSCVDYGFRMELSEEEKTRYSGVGRSYISKLAADIQYSAPGVIGSRSPFKDRSLGDRLSVEILAAIKLYQQRR